MELEEDYEAFRQAGAEVLALAVAPITAVDGARKATGATYPLLADPIHRVAEAYGVYDLLGDGRAAPAAFVIDTDGHIAWSYVGQHPSDRPSIQTILEHLP